MSTELNKGYSVGKTLTTGSKPVAGFFLLKYAIELVGNLTGNDVPDDISTKAAIGIFGFYRAVRNFMKNRKK